MMDNQFEHIKYSVLDLAPVIEGSTASNSFKNSLELARHVEKLGYYRYWLAEHHSMPGIASSATSVVIGYIAGGTSKIRVGSGGIMLPNHAPLAIAEQFGTLESMYPGRIDLGLGRAPGSDQLTARAMRSRGGHDFPEQLEELRTYFNPSLEEKMGVRAFPGEGLNIPIWLLGSSGFSAELAGRLGLPFAFASHFSPAYTLPALDMYRKSFQPSDVLKEPYVNVCLNIIAAGTDEEAEYLSTSQKQQFLSLIRGKPTQLKPPIEDVGVLWNSYEKELIDQKLNGTITGSYHTVKEKLQAFLNKTSANEIMINTQIYDHQARLKSYEIVADIFNGK